MQTGGSHTQVSSGHASKVTDGIAVPNPPLKVSAYTIRRALPPNSAGAGSASIVPSPEFSLRVARDDLLVAGTKQRTAIEFTRIAISKREAAGYQTSTLMYTAPFNGFGPVAAAFTAKALGLKCKLILSRRPIGQPYSLPTQAVMASENVKLVTAFGAQIEIAASWLTLLEEAKKVVAEDPTVFWLPLGFKTTDGSFSEMLAGKIREALEQAEKLENVGQPRSEAEGSRSTVPGVQETVELSPLNPESCASATEPSTRNAVSLREQPPSRVFVAGGTGALGVALSKVFPSSKIYIVPGNIDPKGVESIRKTVEQCDRAEQCVVLEKHSPALLEPPFPTIAGYDQLAWDAAVELGAEGDLVWNVAGVPSQSNSTATASVEAKALPPARGRGFDRKSSGSGAGGRSTLDTLLGRKRERAPSPPAAREAS